VTRSDWKTYRRFAALLRPHRGRLAAVLAASAAGPVLLAARIWLLKVLIDSVLAGHHPQLLPAVAGGFAGIAVLSAAIGSWKTGASGRVGAQVTAELRLRCYGALQDCPLRYFHGQRLGDLLTRLSADIAAIEDMLITGLTAITLLLGHADAFPGPADRPQSRPGAGRGGHRAGSGGDHGAGRAPGTPGPARRARARQ
jgi:ABC-type multidrug transport system fused ATPase/permease subunit